MLIRPEEPKDQPAIHCVNEAAFARPAEADLVDALRKEVHPFISLVAELDGEIVGHILFTPVSLSGHAGLKIMGLGPMAVMPGQQGKGIGSQLVMDGLERCKDLGYGAVIVLGHTWFYPRFGFTPTSTFGINCEYDVPPEAFMALELQPGYLTGKVGTIRYHPAFAGV